MIGKVCGLAVLMFAIEGMQNAFVLSESFSTSGMIFGVGVYLILVLS
jgi:hypothetical protein